MAVDEIVAAAMTGRPACKRVWRMLDIAEYKRRQAPPGVKITRARLRPRPPLSDHQRLPRLLASRARRCLTARTPGRGDDHIGVCR